MICLWVMVGQPDKSMRIDLIRYSRSDHGTFGRLITPEREFHCLELPWRENNRGLSCIPVGEYECSRYRSRKFKEVFIVNGVPSRSGILIHWGNFAGDVAKGLLTHSQGCILIGSYVGRMRGQLCVMASKFAFTDFMDSMAGVDGFTLKIRERLS